MKQVNEMGEWAASFSFSGIRGELESFKSLVWRGIPGVLVSLD